MKRLVFICLLVFLVGCQDRVHTPTHTETTIDWVDFIYINGQKYDALYTLAIADVDHIGEKIGEVQFKVDENITDPSYEIVEGDAAFWEKGTVIYAVKGMPELIAVQDRKEVNGYRIYQQEKEETSWEFKHIRADKIERVEIQKGYVHPQVINELTSDEEINEILALLNSGKKRSDTEYSEEDPEIFNLVFYDDHPVAAYYPLFHEGDTWYWHPWDEEELPSDISKFMK